MNIIVLGISHHKAPLKIREKVYFRKEKLSYALRMLKEYECINECVILSTCNRTEIYIVTEDLENGKSIVKKFLANYHDLENKELEDYLYEKNNKEAIEHLIRVSSSLDSMVLGEQQILGQIKDAYHVALECGTTNLVFNVLFQKILNVTKKIRTKTGIGEGALSLSSAAIELAKRIFNDLTDKRVMIVGLGKMGELLIKHLNNNGIKKIWVVNRNIDKANDVAIKFNGEAASIDNLYEIMPLVDIVIVSTTSPHYVIKKDDVEYALNKHRNKTVFLIDLGVPRNIDPKINSLKGVILYDIDGLKIVVEANRKRRLKEVELAEKIIKEEMPEIISWHHSLEITPIVHEIKRSISEICRKEILNIDKSLDEKRVEEHVSVIVNKILALPMSKIKEQLKAGDGYMYIKALSELFQNNKKGT
ncbi:MAG: glutamyl-tRNA reductase [bacterium]|nr:glutamyl-tRNA reductase [bacterium]